MVQIPAYFIKILNLVDKLHIFKLKDNESYSQN